MSEEEYLEARGWTRRLASAFHFDGYRWEHPRNGRMLPIAQAVEHQLAEDRAALAFVFSRSIFRATFPDGAGLTVDFTDATIETAEKGAKR